MKSYMKAIAIASVVLILAVGTCGCTSSTTNQNINGSDQGSSNAGVSVKLKYVGTSQSMGQYATASSGKTYMIYTATVKNINAQDRTVDPLFFTMRDTKGGVYDADLWGSSQPGTLKTVTKTQSGDTMSGKVVFEVPKGTVAKSITYDDGFDTIVTNVK